MDLKERKWMDLSRYESELRVVFLRDLEVIMSEFRSKVCELFDLCDRLEKMF